MAELILNKSAIMPVRMAPIALWDLSGLMKLALCGGFLWTFFELDYQKTEAPDCDFLI